MNYGPLNHSLSYPDGSFDGIICLFFKEGQKSVYCCDTQIFHFTRCFLQLKQIIFNKGVVHIKIVR